MLIISFFPSVDPLTGEVIGQRDPDVTLRQLSAPAPVKSNNTIQLDLDWSSQLLAILHLSSIFFCHF